MTLTAMAAAALLGMAGPSWAAPADTSGDCVVQLRALSRSAAAPGQEFELFGDWGDSQDGKRPSINKGSPRELEVVSWSRAALRVRVPRGLAPGDYKVGVYCAPQGGARRSSRWTDFTVLASAADAPAEQRPPPAEQRPEPPAEPAAMPDGPWRGSFEASWRARGRRMAREKGWLRRMTVLVVADQDADPKAVAEIAAAVTDQLAALGAARLRVEAGPAAPPELVGCSRDGVLDPACWAAALRDLRRSGEDYAGAALLFVTDSAIGALPRQTSAGETIGPPAGAASAEDGWILVSEFWTRRSQTAPDFARHGRDHTARHELLHFLGLPHHEELPNPGFPEARLCTRCTHRGAGSHEPPHSECGMSCGAGDDDWLHAASFGKGFGFCPKCAAAARAVVAGIEEP